MKLGSLQISRLSFMKERKGNKKRYIYTHVYSF